MSVMIAHCFCGQMTAALEDGDRLCHVKTCSEGFLPYSSARSFTLRARFFVRLPAPRFLGRRTL